MPNLPSALIAPFVLPDGFGCAAVLWGPGQTTAVPPNMFLAASLGAQCKQLAQLQRGIAFSSFMSPPSPSLLTPAHTDQLKLRC